MSQQKTFRVTHTIARSESYSIEVKASSKKDAIIKADELLSCDVPFAEYEPGDVIDDGGEWDIKEIEDPLPQDVIDEHRRNLLADDGMDKLYEEQWGE